ncbi:MAG: endo-1,4-beta-xylanase [Lachnospiraceae bacterium]|nr:endo-1,4-beta-xylanase [Lachnospiraceae bacterium]
MRKWKAGILAILLALATTSCSFKEVSVSEEEAVLQESQTTGSQEASKQQSTTSKETSEQQDAASEETSKQQDIASEEALKDLFAKYDMKAGTCLSDYMIGKKNCVNIIKANFNSVTFENQLKPDYILDQKASKKAGDLVVTFNSSTKELLKWCSENDMAVRGHTLVWYSQTPQWIFYEDFNPNNALVSRDVMLARMESYISQVFTQLEDMGYLEMFYAYDVVNEAWMEDGTMRDNLWLQTIGEDYMWYAFYYADKYAPDYIDLYYNDYNEQFKTEALYNFVQTLVDEEGNYLIDGIGLQAHLYTEDNLNDYLNTVEKLGSTGLKVNLTELDVCLGSWPEIKPATEENLKAQGQYYYNLIQGVLKLVEEDKVEMDALTFWGFMDSLSWRSERSPMLYDSMYQPKYAYYGAMQIKEKAGFDE